MTDDNKRDASEQFGNAMPREYGDVFVRREALLKQAETRLYMGPPIPHQGMRANDTQLINLFRDCFSMHSTRIYTDFNIYKDGKVSGILPQSLGEFQTSLQRDRYISADSLTRIFLDQFYVVPTVQHLRETAGYNDPIEENGNSSLSLDEFYMRISSNPISVQTENNIEIGTNKISYLLGEVGVGKSTFISKLMLRAARQVDDDAGWRLVPISIDFEDSHKDGDELLPIDLAFWGELYRKIYDTIERQTDLSNRTSISELVVNTKLQNGSTREDIVFQIACLSKRLAEKKLRLLFVFDNLDRYHFRYTQYSFFTKYADDQMLSIRSNVASLVNTFSRNDLWNSGFCVLFVCREYLYDVMSQDGVVSTADDHFGVFRLASTPVSEVIASRSRLYRRAVSFLEPELVKEAKGESSVTLEHLRGKMGMDRLVKALETPNAAISALDKAGHNGHRSLVKFFGSLSLKYTDTEAWERLLEKQPSLLLLLYICNNRHRFSQRQAHFPNVFLNDCLIASSSGFDEAHRTHRHSYWLKYLMLRYIARIANDDTNANARTNAVSEAVTPEKVIRFFTRSDGYEDHLVRLMLGSLCTTSEFGCLEIDHYPSHKRLRLTRRGKYMIGRDEQLFPGDISQDFCLNFTYLQLVIDDLSLAIPRSVSNEIFKDVDYKYLYYPNSRYNPVAADTVVRKLRAVLYFVHILAISAKKEEEFHPELFRALRGLGIALSGEEMRHSLLHTARNLLLALHRQSDLERLQLLDQQLVDSRSILDIYSVPSLALQVEVD